MKIVVDMPDGMYNSIIENGKGTIAQLTTELYGVLCRATPLPKGHGNLKDMNDLCYKSHYGCKGHCDYFHTCDLYGAPTIIEANKEESEDKDGRIE